MNPTPHSEIAIRYLLDELFKLLKHLYFKNGNTISGLSL